ncbi:MAG: pyridoxal phosphate-dependent aminotransferase [Saprospiraceae bacterium]|nr:pyridoxal phosphate-dependent aminotransferase [Saprospiraceae bacterium]
MNVSRLLSDRVQQMEESATIRMAQRARDLNAQGIHVINLSVGEPDFDTPENIKNAAKEALDQGITHYTPVPGLMELRQAIAEKFKRDNGLEYKAQQIVVSNGAKQSIANVCLALLNPGDEVIIFSPFWVSNPEMVKMAEGVPVMVHAGIEQDFKVDPAQLEAAITDKTKMLLFSSPCNPTGSVYTRQELAAIAEVLEKHPDIVIVSDEIYEYINFGEKHFSIGSLPAMKDRTVTVNGFSKGFAMTGWRLGYIGAPGWLAEACSKVQGQFTSGANAFSQKAAAHAILHEISACTAMRDVFLTRRDLFLDKLRTIPGLKVNQPQGAFYVFPDVSTFFGKKYRDIQINDADDLSEYLLSEAHVSLVSGIPFGAPECIRMSYANAEDEILEAADRIKAALAKLEN